MKKLCHIMVSSMLQCRNCCSVLLCCRSPVSRATAGRPSAANVAVCFQVHQAARVEVQVHFPFCSSPSPFQVHQAASVERVVVRKRADGPQGSKHAIQNPPREAVLGHALCN